VPDGGAAVTEVEDVVRVVQGVVAGVGAQGGLDVPFGEVEEGAHLPGRHGDALVRHP
jgi:hypothetical protein